MGRGEGEKGEIGEGVAERKREREKTLLKYRTPFREISRWKNNDDDEDDKDDNITYTT